MEHSAGRSCQSSSTVERKVSRVTDPDAPLIHSGTFCPILYFDIAAFGDPSRDSDIQTFVRSGLYRILRAAFGRVGVPWQDCYHEDRGDGVLVIAPPVNPIDAVAALPPWLHAEIQRHNKCASVIARIQLRAALHVGPVYWDEYGVCGEAVIHAARLIDLQQGRVALSEGDADLVFIRSATVHESVVPQGLSVSEPEYQRIKTRVKESSITAWINVWGAGNHARRHLVPVRKVP